MRAISIALALCAPFASEPASPSYAARRAELRKALPSGVTVLFGRAASDSDDLHSGFYQEPNLYYLTGWSKPGATWMLSPAGDALFLPAKDKEAEKWTEMAMDPKI